MSSMKRPASSSAAQGSLKLRAVARGSNKKRPAASGLFCKRPATFDDIEEKNRLGQAVGERKMRVAEFRGLKVINHGAGTMPVGAPAPFGGTRYTILQDPANASVKYVSPHKGQRDRDGKLVFIDAPEFRPNLTPEECIRAGIFGGCYFNPRGGKPGIFGRDVAIDHIEFPSKWFKGLPDALYKSRRYNVATNKYGVKSGQGQAFWEMKGWMHEQDPRGWFQWYCRFFQGRRTLDDARQIERWSACASERGRWRNQLCGRVWKEDGRFDDLETAPVIRQTLLHWAYELDKQDWALWKSRNT